MILTRLNDAQQWKWKELNQGDVRERHGGIVPRRIWKDFGLSQEDAVSEEMQKENKAASG